MGQRRAPAAGDASDRNDQDLARLLAPVVTFGTSALVWAARAAWAKWQARRLAQEQGGPPHGPGDPPDPGGQPPHEPAEEDVELDDELDKTDCVDETTLREVAIALLEYLPLLLTDDPAAVAELSGEITRVLGLPPGRARERLLRLLLEETRPRLRSWVLTWLRSAASDDRAKLLPKMWLEGRDQDDQTPLSVGTGYTAVLMVGDEGSDHRYGGLLTRWVVASSTVRLEAHPDDPGVVVSEPPDRGGWLATFEMRLPEEGDATRRRLRITPVVASEAQLEADVYVGADLYRRLILALTVAETGGADADHAPTVAGPVVELVRAGRLSLAHAGLASEAEWQRPHRRVFVVADGSGSGAQVHCEELGLGLLSSWPAMPGEVQKLVKDVRGALDGLRQAFPDYFESITAERLAEDLAASPPPASWADGEDDACPGPFREQWSAVAEGRELWNLAYYGHQLYQAVFDEHLRSSCMDKLEPGDLVNVICYDGWGGRVVPHLPLPLMYTNEVISGVPVDPTRFLGLRHRIAYTRRPSDGSRALGSWKLTTRAHILYEAAQASDAVATESRRHAAELARWQTDDGRTRFLPGGAPLTEVTQFLASPGPTPVSLLYFYCHSGDRAGPYLRLGPTNADTDIVRAMDMGTKPFEDRPLVFVNACGSSAADPGEFNPFMNLFLNRHCRAYIGTETRVPPCVAARFATAFFTALYGTAWDVQAPVGEAVAQARRFLWRRYRNLGGLFYSYVNDYLLYAAEHEHVASLQASSATHAEDAQ